jgi:hypothetical protein
MRWLILEKVGHSPGVGKPLRLSRGILQGHGDNAKFDFTDSLIEISITSESN